MNPKEEAVTTAVVSSSGPSRSKNRDRSSTEASSFATATELDAPGEEGNGGMQPHRTDDLPRWFPVCCGKPILHGKPEALGFLMGMTGQMIGIIGVLTFVAPALLYFAKLEAGCEVEAPEGETEVPECNKEVYGMKPSSFITTLTTVTSLLVACSLPLMGAIIDHTSHRRSVGRVLAFMYICCVVPHIFMSEQSWFPLALSVLVWSIFMLSLTLCLHSYLPELTDNEEELNDLTKAFVAVPGINVIIFLFMVIAIATVFGVSGDTGATARIAASLGVIGISPCFFAAWGLLLQTRPALHVLEEGQSILTAGFKQIYRTCSHLYSNNVALLWFYAAIALGDIKPLTSIALTFLSSQQQFSSFDVGIAALVMLVTVLPGAVLSSWVCRKINPIRSSVLSLICMSTVTLIASVTLTGGGQHLQTYALVACWGTAGGWKVTSSSMLVAAIIPEGKKICLLPRAYLTETVS